MIRIGTHAAFPSRFEFPRRLNIANYTKPVLDAKRLGKKTSVGAAPAGSEEVRRRAAVLSILAARPASYCGDACLVPVLSAFAEQGQRRGW